MGLENVKQAISIGVPLLIFAVAMIVKPTVPDLPQRPYTDSHSAHLDYMRRGADYLAASDRFRAASTRWLFAVIAIQFAWGVTWYMILHYVLKGA